MKHFLFLLLAITLLFTVGCSQKASRGLTTEDLLLNIDGTSYRCGTEIETIIKQMGDGYEYAEGKSCDYDGLDKTYRYEAGEFYTYPAKEGDLINEIYTQNSKVTTSKGISVGAAKADVIAAYGEPESDDGFQMIYRTEDASAPGGKAALIFDLSNGAVASIFITTQAQAIGGN